MAKEKVMAQHPATKRLKRRRYTFSNGYKVGLEHLSLLDTSWRSLFPSVFQARSTEQRGPQGRAPSRSPQALKPMPNARRTTRAKWGSEKARVVFAGEAEHGRKTKWNSKAKRRIPGRKHVSLKEKGTKIKIIKSKWGKYRATQGFGFQECLLRWCPWSRCSPSAKKRTRPQHRTSKKNTC